MCGKMVGTQTLNQESQLKNLNTAWSTDPRVLTVLLASCHSHEQLRLNNVILNHDRVSSICYQNGQTLKVLKLDHYCKTEWIQLIIDNCLELNVLDLSTARLSEGSIEYVTKNVTPKISKLWLTGIKSDTKWVH